ncbi:hypothetical protein [Gordonia rhizosphera]|uniref:Uncharacterized protein n=1 Tax=Gordonia rhizosphera NBRC 16068 TaxID=1108045 RepID=K6UZV3_9ACTN|nr:hypothetical protein [Gordonia rhizosphera]GAB89078.1 hypothetical protein GORHZ_049_00110 [Gordonia rhizosphera NBRC 16068]
MTARAAARVGFLADVFTCAPEGGIGYWSRCSHYQWTSDQRAVIADLDEVEHTITLDTIARGITAIIGGDTALAEGHRRRIAAASPGDATGLDTADADTIVQTALFGHPIYG